MPRTCPTLNHPVRLLLSLLLISAVVCARRQSGQEVVARVNGDPVTMLDLKTIAPVPEGDSPAARAARLKCLDQAINRRLIVQAATQLGYLDSLASTIERLESSLLVKRLMDYVCSSKPTASEIAAESIAMMTEVRARLIEVPTWDTALMVQRLLKQGVPFETLAAKYNRSIVTQEAGDLGYQPLARYPLEVREALAKMQPGSISDLIIRDGIYYDFVQFLDRRPSSVPDSLLPEHDVFVRTVQAEKPKRYLLATRNRIQYDEEAIDYLTSKTESVTAADSLRVIARLPNGLKTRIGYLLPLVRSYGGIYPHLKRRALKEDIENDILSREARRLKLDRTPEYQTSRRKELDKLLYDTYYHRMISARAQCDSAEVAAWYHANRDRYPARSLPQIAREIRARLEHERRNRIYDSIVASLRARSRIWTSRRFVY